MVRTGLAWWMVAAAVACVLPGCGSASSSSRAQDSVATVRADPQPEAPPTRVVLVTDVPSDENLNGYPDTFTVVVYLFRPPYELPVWHDGRFEFAMLDEQQQVRARWSFEGERLVSSRFEAGPGPSHMFRLNLNEVSTDRLPLQQGELLGRFTPRGGRPVESPAPIVVQIGADPS